jgi:hypothetical protein
MNTAERILLALFLFIGGVSAGMAFEHQRFLKEIQLLKKKHMDAPGDPAPTPEVAA